MNDEKMIQAMRKRNEADGARLRQQPRPDRRKPDCPSLPRLRQALLRQDWTSTENEHREGCPACQKTEERLRATIWHPSLAQLLAHARQQLNGDDLLDVGYHLNEDGCAVCGQALALLQRDANLLGGTSLAEWKRTLSTPDIQTIQQQEEAARCVSLSRLRQGGNPFTFSVATADSEPDCLSSDVASLETFLGRTETVNPFLDNRINGPSLGDIDVAGIHQSAFERLTGLAREAHTARRGIGAILSGEAGIGKSHLLSRLGRWAAGGTASFVYLHNLQAAPEHLPRSILHAVLGILTLGRRSQFHQTPLYDLVYASILEAVGHDRGFRSWVDLARAYQKWIERQMSRDLPGATLIDATVYEVLFAFFRSVSRTRRGKEDGSVATLAVRWLSGQPLDPVEARLLDLPPSRRSDEAVALEDHQQIKQVLVALTRLAACKGQPFVLAFDQVDNLETDQFAALGRFLEALIDSSPNLLVVTAGIRDTLLRWRVEGAVQESAWHRLAQFDVQLLRLTPEQALQVVEARLDHFFTPFATLGEVQRLRQVDPLFPLGRAWHEQFLRNKIEIRPRDVINWAREGWRREQEVLARLTGPAWLDTWQARQGSPPGDTKQGDWTEEQLREAIDRKVDERMATLRSRRQQEPGGLPANADHLAGILYGLLAQCRDEGQFHGVFEVERMPPPRKNAQPTYHLSIRRRLAGGEKECIGLLVLTVGNATSVAGFLRRLREDSRSLDRLVLVTDERVGLPLGEKGQEYLDEMRTRPGRRFQLLELKFTEYAELEALRVVAQEAGSGDLEIEMRPGHPLPISAAEVIASHQRKGRYLASHLLRELLGEPAGVPRETQREAVTS
jgi:hypothetical protein